MKFTGNHFGLLFLTSAELEPHHFLSEINFIEKLSEIFAPWEAATSSAEIPSAEELKALCKTTEMSNMVVKNFEGKSKLNRKLIVNY